MTRHFLRDDDVSAAEQREVLAGAAALAGTPRLAADALTGTAIGLLFEKPSLRTRVSSEVAVARTGAIPIQLRRDELQLVRGETADDTARVLGGYLGLLQARVFEHDTLEALAASDSLPIVNGLSDAFHPLQVVADLLTLRQEWGPDLKGRTLAYIGDGNNVATSLMLGGALAGLDVIVACPDGYVPDAVYTETASGLAAQHGGSIQITSDPVRAAERADAVYTDVWTSMGDEGTEYVRRAALRDYRIDAELMSHASDEAIVLHCLPAHRGEEITGEVIESPASRIFRQAHNRLPAAAAIYLFVLAPERLIEIGTDS